MFHSSFRKWKYYQDQADLIRLAIYCFSICLQFCQILYQYPLDLTHPYPIPEADTPSLMRGRHQPPPRWPLQRTAGLPPLMLPLDNCIFLGRTIWSENKVSVGGCKSNAIHSDGSKGAPPFKFFSISSSFWENLTKSYLGAFSKGLAPPPTGNPGSALASDCSSS